MAESFQGPEQRKLVIIWSWNIMTWCRQYSCNQATMPNGSAANYSGQRSLRWAWPPPPLAPVRCGVECSSTATGHNGSPERFGKSFVNKTRIDGCRDVTDGPATYRRVNLMTGSKISTKRTATRQSAAATTGHFYMIFALFAWLVKRLGSG